MTEKPTRTMLLFLDAIAAYGDPEAWNPRTVRACVERGWIERNPESVMGGNRFYLLTDAGRKVLSDPRQDAND